LHLPIGVIRSNILSLLAAGAVALGAAERTAMLAAAVLVACLPGAR
jgi:hypothetical protein